MKKYYKSLASVIIACLMICFFASCSESGGQPAGNTVEVVFMPTKSSDASEAKLAAAKSVIEKRLNSLDLDYFDVSTDSEKNLITVVYSLDEEFDIEKLDKDELEAGVTNINEFLGKTAELTFRSGKECAETVLDSDGNPVYKIPAGKTKKVLMDGSSVESAEAGKNENGENYVKIKFDEDGKEKFARVTSEHIDEIVSIWMDDVMLSAPVVRAEIEDGEAILADDFSANSAEKLAVLIDSGTMPFALRTVSSDINLK